MFSPNARNPSDRLASSHLPSRSKSLVCRIVKPLSFTRSPLVRGRRRIMIASPARARKSVRTRLTVQLLDRALLWRLVLSPPHQLRAVADTPRAHVVEG